MNTEDEQMNTEERSGKSREHKPVTALCCFSIPQENIRKPKGFLMFSGIIEKQHRTVMG